MELCPCGSKLAFAECCSAVIKKEKKARTAEALMRSRYSAFVKGDIGYLRDSLARESRDDFDEKATREWAEKSDWKGLEIIRTEQGGEIDRDGKVEFIARYMRNGEEMQHHELSTFKKDDSGNWFFVDGVDPGQQKSTVVREEPKIGRNDPCPCGSGKKYKKCCG